MVKKVKKLVKNSDLKKYHAEQVAIEIEIDSSKLLSDLFKIPDVH